MLQETLLEVQAIQSPTPAKKQRTDMMPRKKLPRIESVKSARKPLTLDLIWSDGKASQVYVGDFMKGFRVYAPLLRSSGAFSKVGIGEYGTDITWACGADMAATTLWRLAREQAGITMTAPAFHRWRGSHDFTLDEAALALGISRRMVAYYEKGEKPIPRLVALATRGFERRV